MLYSLVGGSIATGKYVPFSFADRGDLWSASAAGAPDTAAARHDSPSIAQGLIAGTLVATETGWHRVEELQAGDRLITFDHGMRPVRAVRISTLFTAADAAPRSLWPVSIPAGALGNRTEMQLLPGQAVLIESDAAEALYGDAFLMVPAGVLDGYKDITRAAPEREVTVVTLEFDDDEVIYTNGTLLVQCPASAGRALSVQLDRMQGVAQASPYQCLTEQQGRRLVEAMHLQA